jgi:hypothetical protein
LVLGGIAVVAVIAVVALVATRGSNGPTSSTSSGSHGVSTASLLTPPLRIGDFVALCGAQPCSATVTTALGQPDNIFSQTYRRESPRQSLVFNACRCGNLSAGDRIQRPDLRGQFAADPSVVTVDNGGTQYTCISGAPAPGETGAVSACAWNKGSLVFAIEAVPALDANAIVALAPAAESGTTGR